MHFSFSSIKTAKECPYRFKLQYIDRIAIRQNSIDTIFGKLIHACVQNILLKKTTEEGAQHHFFRTWKRFCKMYCKRLPADKMLPFLRAGINILEHVNEAFEGYETLTSEELLYEPLEINSEHQFKGFIDVVLRKDNRIVIVDLKTSPSAYMFQKYLDPIKSYQLSYYKNYYASKHNIPLDSIDVLFIVLEKNPTSKRPIQFIPQSSGTKKIHNALQVLNNTLGLVNNERYPKNRTQCYDEKTKIRCPYYQTEFCK